MTIGLRDLLSTVRYEHIIDTSNHATVVQASLDKKSIRQLAKAGDSKKRVMKYIKSLSPGMQLKLVEQALDKESPLSKFFYTARGLTTPTTASGHLKEN